MAKRADTLTGGTKDVNPQYISGAVVMTTVNTAKEETIGLPILRPGQGASQTKAQVIELLKCWVHMPSAGTDFVAANTAYSAQFTVATSSQGTTVPNLSNTRVLAQFRQAYAGAFTAAGTYSTPSFGIQVWDFTDGAGHGILVGTDNLFLQADTDGYAAGDIPTMTYKLLYRFKEVSLIEYIGMVQSQQ